MINKLFFTLLFGIFMHAAWSQDVMLSYEEAVQLGLQQNVDLRMQQNEMKVVKAEKNQAIGGLAPNVFANVNAFRSSGNTFLEQEAKTINTTSDNLAGGLEANLNLFNGFAQMNRIRLGNANFDAQHHLLDKTVQDVIVTVTKQYLQVLLDSELLEIAEDNLKTQQLLLKQIEAMVEAGNRPRSDLYDQLATVKNRELLVLQAKNDLSNDKSNLAITLQLDPTINFGVGVPEWDLAQISMTEYKLDELYQRSIAHRPDLKQFRSEEQANERAVAIAKASFAPSLTAFYGFSTRYNDQSIRSFDEQLAIDNKRNQFGLALNIPIYSGLKNRTFLVRQKVNYENAQIETENLEKTILNDVRNAYQNFMDVKTAYEVSMAQQEAADMALKVQQEKYTLGVGSLIELSASNNNYIQAASKLAQARLNLLFQKVLLDYQTGVLQAP
ncbi:MAG: TolC family protein [Cyclobacteriaceae bacterium]|nr:TolC family protein [Cyclobacteriaceae bacterium]